MNTWFKKYKRNYLNHLKKLGYSNHEGDFDLYFVKNAFFISWSKPGFHFFWRHWNPGIAYMTFWIYKYFGGNKNKVIATYMSFIICGLIHNIVVYPFLGWSYTIIVVFICFSTFTLISKILSTVLNQKKWHWAINTVINISLVLLSFEVGFTINGLLTS
jgi:hypothetical protein